VSRAQNIAIMIMLALRLMPILLTEKERIEIAQKARGYNLYQADFITRIKAFLSLILIILLSVFRRADNLALAIDVRNYQRGARTSLVKLKITHPDYLVLIFSAILIVIFVALNLHFG
jgi:energy-coupling factor transport system permease protein